VRFAARFLVLCALGAATLGAAGTEPVGHLLGRMRDASGSPWRAHIVSTSPLLVEGDTLQATTESAGMQFLLRWCEGAVCAGRYFDGTRLFVVSANGTALPMTRDPQPGIRALRVIGSLAFLDPSFERAGGRVDDDGYTTLNGIRFRRLALHRSDMLATEILVDDRTALVRSARAGQSIPLEYRDYRRVGSYTLPFEVDASGSPVDRFVTRTVSSDPLVAPQGLKPSFAASAVPIRLSDRSPSPVGTCTIAGVSVSCLLDTGNSGLSMSLELADQLHLMPVGASEVRGLGRYATEVVRTGPLRVGGATFPEADYVVLHDIHRYGYDLILGADVLASTQVEIDNAAHLMWFGDRAFPRGAGVVPFVFVNLVPVLNVELGDVATQLVLDTGDESTINLGHEFYVRHTGLFSASQALSVAGVGGSGTELIGKIARVRIGDYVLEDAPIGATLQLRGTAFGHIGAAFLEHFRVLLDYPHSQLELLPNPGDGAIRQASGPPPP
jgi:gag-polyprotein putative aspartyl protease